MIKKVLLVVILAIMGQGGYSCSCPPLQEIDSTVYGNYSSIILGEIIDVLDAGDASLKIIKVRVIQSFNGNSAGIISITTPSSVGACGITPSLGETWLLYSVEQQNVLYTNRCSRSGNIDLSSYHPHDRKALQIENDLAFLKK